MQLACDVTKMKIRPLGAISVAVNPSLGAVIEGRVLGSERTLQKGETSTLPNNQDDGPQKGCY